jgi:beta-ribofuranosylaminobenzene 5'-phosphate synthase
VTGSAVLVQAPARLHLGLIDLRGDLGRRFGGMGAALASPSLLLEARDAEALSAEGPEAERLLGFAQRFLERHGIRRGARLRVQHGIPRHSGLGSGTQLALATGRALSRLFGLACDARELALATGRAERSAIGTWAFEAGGFILEGGRRDDDPRPAPLLLRYPLPPDWRCVVAIPDVARGLSGAAEEAAFQSLPPPPQALVARIAHLILMQVLPALVEDDLADFGRGVTEVQRLVGETFRPVQGERFAHPRSAELIEALLAAGAEGAGQSSWGPAVYGLVRGDEAAQRLGACLGERLAGRGQLCITAFDNAGARCWSEDGAADARADQLGIPGP